MKIKLLCGLALAFVSIGPVSSYAEGNCSFRAYNNCFEPKGAGNPPHFAVYLLCHIRSNLREGMFSADNLESCKEQARELGQYVSIQYKEFDSEKITHTHVYQY